MNIQHVVDMNKKYVHYGQYLNMLYEYSRKLYAQLQLLQ